MTLLPIIKKLILKNLTLVLAVIPALFYLRLPFKPGHWGPQIIYHLTNHAQQSI